MIDRRSVPPSTAHACISETNRNEKEPSGIMSPGPLKTDMTAFFAWRRGAQTRPFGIPVLDPRVSEKRVELNRSLRGQGYGY